MVVFRTTTISGTGGFSVAFMVQPETGVMRAKAIITPLRAYLCAFAFRAKPREHPDRA